VPATTRIRGVGAEVELDAADGLPQDCVLNLDQVQIARKAYLTDPITTLTSKRMHEVCEALAFATGC
jgi:mRNA-degrading endonuclease toxin of MazEF toxin-antitoxin module